MNKTQVPYANRHSEIKDYFLTTLKDESKINKQMEAKNIALTYNLKVPHFADIIYSVVKLKKLNIKTVCKFINIGEDESGNPKIIDIELSNSLLTIDKLVNDLSDLLPDKGNQSIRELVLATFPSYSKFTNHPLNPSLSEVYFIRVYINGIISFCEEESNKVRPVLAKIKGKNNFLSSFFRKVLNALRP